MYHDVVPQGAEDSSGFPGRDAALYKVTPETFEAHLAALDGRGGNGRPHGAVSTGTAGADLPLSPSITFDDGGVSAAYAADALERDGRRGHFFITANYIGAPGFLDVADLRDLHARGHLVGSHSCSHPLRMGHCSDLQLQDEWTRSRARLCDILGADVRVASVPGGDYADRVARSAAEAGFRQLFTSEPTTAVRRAGGIAVCGRFTIQRWTTAETVVALVQGNLAARARERALWTAKKVAKRLGGAGYLQIRKLLLRHDDAVAWGDHPGGFPARRSQR